MAEIQRSWHPPDGHAEAAASGASALRLQNSFTDQKEPLVPSGGRDSRYLTWYSCGPTVYDCAHMGHSRNYVTFDILRRILEDYFNYDIRFIMNVTDVDDKIILRARRGFLLKRYEQSTKDVSKVKEDVEAALRTGIEEQQKKVDKVASQRATAQAAAQGEHKAKKEKEAKALGVALDGEKHKLEALQSTLATVAGLSDVEELLRVGGDALAGALDAVHKAEVTDKEIFRAHAAHYEEEFFKDMEALGCRAPNLVTRVSEYIPEIIDYVKTIIANGMAYAVNGSVYFNTAEFRKRGHVYGKLNPWAVGSATLAAEGEANFENSEKENKADFALWKASKPGEPSWASPWGDGRPGWHIECSAMATSVLGSRIDIHSGGEDLRFPHHDNELAQAEAFMHSGPSCTPVCQQWVNYFLHSGHLSIEGLKMSKSLKNFITIREALKTFSPRQMRLMFALQPWDKPMTYGEAARDEMRCKEQLLKNFFQNVDVVLRAASPQAPARCHERDEKLIQLTEETKRKVHEALLDNLNTRLALDSLCDLIRDTNKYLSACESEPQEGSPHPLLVRNAAALVTRILRVFGLSTAGPDELGFGGEAAKQAGGEQYLDALAAFRDDIRRLAKAKAPSSEIMSSCDRVRDTTLVDLGVRLEDRPDGTSVWKLEDAEKLRQEAAEKAAMAAAARSKKLQAQLALKSTELAKLEKLAALPPIQDMPAIREKYGRFDGDGMPTHDAEGKELDAKAQAKARKDIEKQVKVRQPLTKLLEADPDALEKLRADVSDLKELLAESSLLSNGFLSHVPGTP